MLLRAAAAPGGVSSRAVRVPAVVLQDQPEEVVRQRDGVKERAVIAALFLSAPPSVCLSATRGVIIRAPLSRSPAMPLTRRQFGQDTLTALVTYSLLDL